MRRKLVAGNWKLNGSKSLAQTMMQAVAQANLSDVDVVICPPFPFLSAFEGFNGKLGAQNVSQFESGAHTGEVATSMLKELGCEYVIIGHSERRADNGETDELVAQKVAAAIDSGLVPILCFGESEDVRKSGDLFTFLQAQIDAVLQKVGIAGFAKLVLAYEPIWAIGTGLTATPEQAQEVHEFVRNYLAEKDADVAAKIVILYGGSVKADNAETLFGQPDIDGGLIGGASLKSDDFIAICQAAN